MNTLRYSTNTVFPKEFEWHILFDDQMFGRSNIFPLPSPYKAPLWEKHWFLSLAEACAKLEQWWEMYNHDRPHSLLGIEPRRSFANIQQIGARMRGQFSQNLAKSVA